MTSQTTSLISFPLLVEYSVNSNESSMLSEGKILKTSLNIFSKIQNSLCFQTEKTKLSKDCWLCLVGGVYNITHQISQESWSKGLFSLSVIPWTDILHIDLECGKSKDTSLFISYYSYIIHSPFWSIVIGSALSWEVTIHFDDHSRALHF